MCGSSSCTIVHTKSLCICDCAISYGLRDREKRREKEKREKRERKRELNKTKFNGKRNRVIYISRTAYMFFFVVAVVVVVIHFHPAVLVTTVDGVHGENREEIAKIVPYTRPPPHSLSTCVYVYKYICACVVHIIHSQIAK